MQLTCLSWDRSHLVGLGLQDPPRRDPRQGHRGSPQGVCAISVAHGVIFFIVFISAPGCALGCSAPCGPAQRAGRAWRRRPRLRHPSAACLHPQHAARVTREPGSIWVFAPRAPQGNVFINQYLIIKDLGKGAHGTVKLVYNTQDDLLYAMKVRYRPCTHLAVLSRASCRMPPQPGCTCSRAAGPERCTGRRGRSHPERGTLCACRSFTSGACGGNRTWRKAVLWRACCAAGWACPRCRPRRRKGSGPAALPARACQEA